MKKARKNPRDCRSSNRVKPRSNSGQGGGMRRVSGVRVFTAPKPEAIDMVMRLERLM